MKSKVTIRRWSKQNLLVPVCYAVGELGQGLGLTIQKPVIIVGTGRCGSSLLSRILSSHPDITGFLDEANDLWHPRLYPYECASIKIPPIEANPGRFTQVSVENWPPNQERRIRNVFNGYHLLERRSKVFFVKSAMISFMIPKIFEIIPNAKFVHIYRSGPSVVESYVEKNFGRYADFVVPDMDYRLICARYWNDCLFEIERAKKSLSLHENNAFIEFSYEALCKDSIGTLESLSGFLGVDASLFVFDFSTITSTNYKVGNYADDKKWEKLLQIMSPAMKLKGYM